MQQHGGVVDKGVTVTTAAAVLATLNVAKSDSVSVQLTNKGSAPLTVFEVWGRVQAGGDFVRLKNSGYMSPDIVAMFSAIDPTTLAAGASTILYLEVSLLESVQLIAKCGTSTIIDCIIGSYVDISARA